MQTTRSSPLALLLVLALGAGALLSREAHAAPADDYPNRAIHLVFPYSAGGVSDLARLVGDRLGERLHQPVLLETRPGASGNLGAEAVARAPADGYTLLVTPPPPLAINQSLFAKLGYDPAALVPVTVLASLPNLLVATRALPASNLRELIAHAKAQPGRLSYASTGNGGTPHLSAERLKADAGVSIVHIPYQGISAALPDLVAGRVDIMFANTTSVLPLVKDGRLKVLAVASAERLALLPDVPTVAETLHGFVSDAWLAVAAPPGTPAAVVDKIALALREVLQLPDVIDGMRRVGALPVGSTPGQAREFIRRETERWAEVIRAAAIKAD
jgi:tripartite-type tricarboxylate transporter receptor subunit TctC